ncbi:hypothetical protein [Rhizobium ruizarguesonis]
MKFRLQIDFSKQVLKKVIATIGIAFAGGLSAGLLGALTERLSSDPTYLNGLLYWIRPSTLLPYLAVPWSYTIKLYVAGGTLALFALRGYYPKIYGWLEIVVGLSAIFYSEDLVDYSIPEALPLATGAYIVVRGLDNIAKNLKNEKKVAEYFTFLFNQPPKEKEKGAKAPFNSEKPARFGVENVL